MFVSWWLPRPSRYQSGSFGFFPVSQTRSEEFSFNSGVLGVDSCLRLVVVVFATVVNRSQCCAMALPLGEAFDGSMTCQIRVK